MTIDQLKLLITKAAEDLVERTDRPHPVTVVVPLSGATRVLSLEAFPDDDAGRKEVLSVVAARQMVPENAPCFGFIAEADGPDGEDLVVVAYGARQRGGYVTAATIEGDGLGPWLPEEPLEADALPFLQPLQHAADTSNPPTEETSALPLI